MRGVNWVLSYPIFLPPKPQNLQSRSTPSLSPSLTFDSWVSFLTLWPHNHVHLNSQPHPYSQNLNQQNAPFTLHLHPHAPLLSLASANLRRLVDHSPHSDGGRGLLLARGCFRVRHFVDVWVLPRLRLRRVDQDSIGRAGRRPVPAGSPVQQVRHRFHRASCFRGSCGGCVGLPG